MLQFGNGWTWQEVYSMPIHLRKFYFNKLADLKKKESKEIEKAKKKSKVRVKR